jgi:nitrate reductase delta subunit
VVAFWTEGDKRHHFKVFKPAAEVLPDDLPYSWMKDGLVVPEGFSCDCC